MLLEMIQNINNLEPNGIKVAISGIVTVFLGLILIALSIVIFNLIFKYLANTGEGKKDKTESGKSLGQEIENAFLKTRKKVDDETLIAIATALELYQRLHVETLQSKITFKKGKQKSNWKMGYKFGHRN